MAQNFQLRSQTFSRPAGSFLHTPLKINNLSANRNSSDAPVYDLV